MDEIKKKGNSFFPNSKKGWIKIVEAFVAILLIAGVLLIVMDKGYIGKTDISSKVYDIELSVLKEIQSDDQLREEILGVDLPAEGDDFPVDLINLINSRIPNYLVCAGKICEIDDICTLDNPINKEIYAKSITITATLGTYAPRQVKLFCWVGEPEEPEIPEICEFPEGTIFFMGGYPLQSGENKIKFKVSTELTEEEFNLRVYSDTENYVDGIPYDVVTWKNVEIIDALDWPDSGSIITIQYDGKCQDKFDVE